MSYQNDITSPAYVRPPRRLQPWLPRTSIYVYYDYDEVSQRFIGSGRRPSSHRMGWKLVRRLSPLTLRCLILIIATN